VPSFLAMQVILNHRNQVFEWKKSKKMKKKKGRKELNTFDHN
jgi:hypothetical protein